MDRIYMNRRSGEQRIHVEILDNEISDLLDDLTTGPEPFAATHVFLDVLRAAEETFSPIVAEGRRDRAARQASGQPDTETVPTPEEGIEDARKAMQHVLQLFLDRVPRDELDAETMADSLADALSDGLTELYRTAASAAPAAGLSDTQPTVDRAAVLREAADAQETDMNRFFAEWPEEPRNSPYANGRKDAITELRRMADEETPR